jgi:hypothetical protein
MKVAYCEPLTVCRELSKSDMVSSIKSGTQIQLDKGRHEQIDNEPSTHAHEFFVHGLVGVKNQSEPAARYCVFTLEKRC